MIRLAPGLVLLLAALATAQDRPPTRRETTDLVDEYLALDARTPAGRTRQLAILDRLDALPPLSEREERDWRKKLMKAQAHGRRLEKSGRGFWWEKEERGLYYVGGDTSRPKGLLIAMHGGGAGAGDASEAHSAWSPGASAFDWVCVSPEVLEKTERGWTDSGTEEFVMDLVDAALRTWRIDPNHVFFAGHSMGGYGTWTLGAHHADRVAGLAPSAGAPTPVFDHPGGTVIDVTEGVIPSLRDVRMAIYQSRDDPRVPPAANQKAVELLGAAKQKWDGFDFEYWEVDGRGHALPEGGTKALLAKIADAERTVVQDRVVWQPVLDWKRQFYWLVLGAPARERDRRRGPRPGGEHHLDHVRRGRRGSRGASRRPRRRHGEAGHDLGERQGDAEGGAGAAVGGAAPDVGAP